jgi:hypothetical protein
LPGVQAETSNMSDVTQFSGMLAKMVLDYSRSAARKRGRKTPTVMPVSGHDALPQDERAIRAAM